MHVEVIIKLGGTEVLSRECRTDAGPEAVRSMFHEAAEHVMARHPNFFLPAPVARVETPVPAPAKSFQCPRRGENPLGDLSAYPVPDNDYDQRDDSCSYCGSLDPVTFMARVEAGTVELGATDKNYKVYVRNAGGEPFKQAFRDCYSVGAKDCKPDTCTHWTVRDQDNAKFYFQHLSAEQCTRFVELMNEKDKLKFEGGMGFYVMPFFAVRGKAAQ